MDVDMAQLLGDGADKTCPDDRSKFGTDPKKIQNVLCYDYIISVFFLLFSRPTWIPLSRRFQNFMAQVSWVVQWAVMNPPLFWGMVSLSSTSTILITTVAVV